MFYFCFFRESPCLNICTLQYVTTKPNVIYTEAVVNVEIIYTEDWVNFEIIKSF